MTILAHNRAKEINQLHNQFCEGLRTTLQFAIKAGELLVAQKKECGHGNWMPWVENNLNFSHATVNDYINCYKRGRRFLNSEGTQNLTITEVSRGISKPSKEELVERKQKKEELEAEAKRLARKELEIEKEKRKLEEEDSIVESDVDIEQEFDDEVLPDIDEKKELIKLTEKEKKRLLELQEKDNKIKPTKRDIANWANNVLDGLEKHFNKTDKIAVVRVMLEVIERKYPGIKS